jgi:hypothetical protein
MSDDEDSDVEVLLNKEDREGNRVIRRKVIAVPKSSKFPEGIKYGLHYGTLDGDTIIRYDNSHGRHEKHVGDSVEEIEFPGMSELHQQFKEDIEEK